MEERVRTTFDTGLGFADNRIVKAKRKQTKNKNDEDK